MDATGTHSESFSVLQAAKDGFKAIRNKPRRWLGMAVAVSLPHILYGVFVRGILVPGQPIWGSGMPGYTSLSLLLRPTNMVAIILLLVALLLLRPIWIRVCLRLCAVDSPRPNRQTYINFAVANILQFLIVFAIAAVMGLGMSLTRDFMQATVTAAGVLLIVSVLLYFVFFPYLIVNRGYGAVQSLKQSVKLARGIFWQLFAWGAVFMLCAAILNSIPLGAVLVELLFGTTTTMVYIRRAQQLKTA